MLYVGVDLHKHSISLCVVDLVGRERKAVERKRFRCEDEEAILAYFARLGPYEAVVEATASYEWFVRLIEPTAARIVLDPGKLRVIAESKKKTDKLDAQTLAEFLAFDEVPPGVAADAADPRASHAGPPSRLLPRPHHVGQEQAALDRRQLQRRSDRLVLPGWPCLPGEVGIDRG